MNNEQILKGEDTIRALLEGKTLEKVSNKYTYKIDNGELLSKKPEDTLFYVSCLAAYKLITEEFTEVATPQVGDWVKVTRESGTTYVGQIDEIIAESGDLYANWNGNASGYLNPHRNNRTWEILSPEQIAEYKREQVFAMVGRKLNEFRSGDIVLLDTLGVVAVVITKKNDDNTEIKLHGINEEGKGYKGKPHQLTPIAFVENQVDLS